MNKVFLMGRVGKSPDVIYTQSGIKVYKFSLAINRSKDRDPDWFDVAVFDRNNTKGWIAEIEKGDLLVIEGKIQKSGSIPFCNVIAKRIVRIPKMEKREEKDELDEEIGEEFLI